MFWIIELCENKTPTSRSLLMRLIDTRSPAVVIVRPYHSLTSLPGSSQPSWHFQLSPPNQSYRSWRPWFAIRRWVDASRRNQGKQLHTVTDSRSRRKQDKEGIRTKSTARGLPCVCVCVCVSSHSLLYNAHANLVFKADISLGWAGLKLDSNVKQDNRWGSSILDILDP